MSIFWLVSEKVPRLEQIRFQVKHRMNMANPGHIIMLAHATLIMSSRKKVYVFGTRVKKGPWRLGDDWTRAYVDALYEFGLITPEEWKLVIDEIKVKRAESKVKDDQFTYNRLVEEYKLGPVKLANIKRISKWK